jgi:hypothetical protein
MQENVNGKDRANGRAKGEGTARAVVKVDSGSGEQIDIIHLGEARLALDFALFHAARLERRFPDETPSAGGSSE